MSSVIKMHMAWRVIKTLNGDLLQTKAFLSLPEITSSCLLEVQILSWTSQYPENNVVCSRSADVEISMEASSGGHTHAKRRLSREHVVCEAYMKNINIHLSDYTNILKVSYNSYNINTDLTIWIQQSRPVEKFVILGLRPSTHWVEYRRETRHKCSGCPTLSKLIVRVRGSCLPKVETPTALSLDGHNWELHNLIKRSTKNETSETDNSTEKVVSVPPNNVSASSDRNSSIIIKTSSTPIVDTNDTSGIKTRNSSDIENKNTSDMETSSVTTATRINTSGIGTHITSAHTQRPSQTEPHGLAASTAARKTTNTTETAPVISSASTVQLKNSTTSSLSLSNTSTSLASSTNDTAIGTSTNRSIQTTLVTDIKESTTMDHSSTSRNASSSSGSDGNQTLNQLTRTTTTSNRHTTTLRTEMMSVISVTSNIDITTSATNNASTILYYTGGEDVYWPVVMALTISVPTICLFAITITVIYRRRMETSNRLLTSSMYALI
ncbi:hypothetical protein ScPMuIL_018573 [Solemya velum]